MRALETIAPVAALKLFTGRLRLTDRTATAARRAPQKSSGARAPKAARGSPGKIGACVRVRCSNRACLLRSAGSCAIAGEHHDHRAPGRVATDRPGGDLALPRSALLPGLARHQGPLQTNRPRD